MSYGIEEDKNGLFGLCVFDAEDITDDEVIEAFEKFGPVKQWNRSKNLCFIRYTTLEDAVQCYEHMQKTSEFRVRAAKNKPIHQRTQEGRARDRFGDQNKNGEMSYKKDESISTRSSGNIYAKGPMPKLKFDVPCTELVDASEAQVYRRVIVAHLHPHMKQSDVYNLCSKAQSQPCHVDMKSFSCSPYSTEYYAIVHVMEESDVRNIVRGLNNLRINGYQLVVAPYEKLVEEGKSFL